MGLSIEVDPKLSSLIKAIGLVDGDGHLIASWFSHPLEAIGSCLSDETQRAALLSLLDEALPPITGSPAPAGSSWHPLLTQNSRGNVYITVSDGVIGVAGSVNTDPTDLPVVVRAALKLPLLDTSDGQVRAIAAGPEGPLELTIAVDLDPTASPAAVAVTVTVDVTGQVRFRVRIEDGSTTPRTVAEFDPTELDDRTVSAVTMLVRSILEHETTVDGAVLRLVNHLPAALGLGDAVLPTMPLDRVAADPGAVRAWLADVAASREKLLAWFTHCAAVLGALPRTDADPEVSGQGTSIEPLQVTLLDLGQGVLVELSLGSTALDPTGTGGGPAGAPPALLLGVNLAVPITLPVGTAELAARLTLASLPLAGTGSATVLPAAQIGVSVPVSGGHVDAGVAWDGVRVVPLLRLRHVTVTIGTTPTTYDLDLTDVDAVVGTAAAGVATVISDALGEAGLGRRLLALIGFLPPEGPSRWTHALDASALTGNLPRAIAGMHRAALADHTWGYLFAELAGLFDLPADPAAAGTRAQPWTATLVENDTLSLQLVAFNDADATTPVQQLRLGLRVATRTEGWQVALLAELVAFDLAEGASTTTRFVGGIHVSVAVTQLPELAETTGITIGADRLEATLSWAPGQPVRVRGALVDLVVSSDDDEEVGPVTLALPPAVDLSAADFGLGLSTEVVTDLTRLLLGRALATWGPTAFAVGGLLGLHGRLPGLDADWPRLLGPYTDLTELLADPVTALTNQARAVAAGVGPDGPNLAAALPWLAALMGDPLPGDPDSLPAVALAGSGHYDNPWVLPAGHSELDVLVWLDPAPPVASDEKVDEEIRSAADGLSLLDLLSRRPLPAALSTLLAGRDIASTGLALDELADWLGDSDALVPYDSQVTVPPHWTVSPPVNARHDRVPQHPDAVAHAAAQLAAWGAGPSRPVLLLSTATGDRRDWADLVAVLEPGHDPDAQLDLRTTAAAALSAAATCYPIDLADDGSAALPDLADQVEAVLTRVRALTGATTVCLVGHGLAGAAARMVAARVPAQVAGVATLATPHAGTPVTPLTRADLADAVRLADLILGAAADDVGLLARVLDGGPARDGVLPLPGVYTEAGLPGVPAGLTENVRGLAIPAKLAGDLPARLAAAVADQVAAAASTVDRPMPDGVGLALQLRLPTPPAGSSGAVLDARLRADLAWFPLGPGALPARPPLRLRLTATLGRPGGWLIGDPGGRAADEASPRAVVHARRAELSLLLEPDPAGGMRVRPSVSLHEAGAPGATARALDLDALLSAAAVRPPRIRIPDGLTGPGADLVLDCLRSLGLTATGSTGDELIGAALSTLVDAPATALSPGASAVLGVLAAGIGATTVAGGGWRLPVAGGALELSLTPHPWTLRLRRPPAATSVDGFISGIDIDCTLVLPAFTGTATGSVSVGPLRLDWNTSPASLDLSMPPWLAPVRLAPAAATTAAAAAVSPLLPRTLLSAALAPMVSDALGVRLPPLDPLFFEPGRWLRTAFSAPNGQGLSAQRITALLVSLGNALGQSAVGALHLPGDVSLTASGVDGGPVEIRLAGSLPFSGSTLHLTLGLRIGPDFAVTPVGTLGIDVTLPGSDWEALSMEFGASPVGLAIAVTPEGGHRIELLPTFSGLGAVAAGATKLLPHVLQQLVTQLRPASGPPTGVLAAALGVATALGIYDETGHGFEGPNQVDALANLLNPDWWQQMGTDPALVLNRLAAMFGPGRLPLPLGSINSDGRTVRWSLDLASVGGPTGAVVAAALGWSQPSQPSQPSKPVITLSATNLDLGPVVLDEATLGYHAGITFSVVAHLDVDGVMRPLRPALEVGLEGTRFRAALLPLGAGTASTLEVRFAPTLAVSASPQAPWQLVERVAIPLAGELVLRILDEVPGTPKLLDRPLWTNGPTAGELLEAGQFLDAGSSPPALAYPLPEPVGAVLRVLQAAADGVTIPITPTLDLTLVTEQGRSGIRLLGYQDIAADDLVVSLRFGRATWLPDYPDAGVTLWLLEPASGQIPFQLTAALSMSGVGVVFSGTQDKPLVDGAVVIGGAGGVLFLGVSFLDSNRDATFDVTEIGAALAVERSFVNVSGGDGDSFLSKILPSELKSPFDLAVIYRDDKLSFGGTSPLSTGHIEFVIPLNLDFSVIKITELLLGLRIATGQFSIEAALSGGADVGPIVATIKRVGLIASVGQGGFGLRFRAPDMVGLAINASTIRLGGFLLIDSERGRYIGAIEIAVLGKLELTAIGIITTKMPDGSPGFSLLFIISMILPVPISLSYGFFFGGAGGLLGLNRGTNFDALRNGLRTGTAESILFPKDIVRRADAIVRDLEAVFPIAQGQFVVGPMVLITWMNPPIVTVKLGIILELGTPIRIGILGLLQLALPEPSAAILNLKCAFLGTVDFAGGLLSFDAAIYDSGIGFGDVKLSIEGDIALRLSWGAKPDFVTSVGGFHPAFHPDAHLRLPQMRRLSISLLKDNPHITMAIYFAITGNSVQIGAKLDFGFEVSGFSITGEFGFDVLIQFSPFLFDAIIYARLLVKAAGQVLLELTMDFVLHGPTPWIARGTATFSVVFIKVTAAFEKVFGPPLEPSIPGIAVLPALLAELGRAENWAAQVPPGTVSVVALLPVQPAEGSVVIEPSGIVSVTQRLAPLRTRMTRFGAYRPNDVARVDPVVLRLGGTAMPTEPINELFSPGAFQALPDDDKLRAPAFVQLPAGLRAVDPSTLHTDYALGRSSRYDLIVFDSKADPADREPRPPVRPDSVDVFQAQVMAGVAGHSPAARLLAEQAERGTVLAVGPAADRYGVARTDDLRPVDATGAVAAVTTGPQGQPVLPAGILLVRPDAEARAQALRQSTGRDYRVVPESQVVVAA